MAKTPQTIKTLQTVPGDGKMIPPHTDLVIGKDICGTIAREFVQAGKAVYASDDDKSRKCKPGAAGSDTKPETRG